LINIIKHLTFYLVILHNLFMENKKYNFLLPVTISLILIVGMQLGFKLRETTWNKRPINSDNTFSKLDEILNLVNVKYVDSVDSKEILNTALDQFLVELDPHSFYIPQNELKSVNESLQGKFEGIGIEFFIAHDTILVVTPISGGPSEALGIISGDKIVMINDTNVAGVGITNNMVIKKLRGDKGTKVKISVIRNAQKEPLDFIITRDKIPLLSVDAGYMIDSVTGYIKISRFAEKTYDEFKVKLNNLVSHNMKNLILDLRQNPGGYLTAATLIADEFIDESKLIVYTEGKAYKRNDHLAKNSGKFETGNLVVLIDEGSASASEIIAGAIQDWDRGIIVGRRSFGKGLVQEQYELHDGSALRLTVARYYTPTGRSIQKPYEKGIDDYYNEVNQRFIDGEIENSGNLEKLDTLKKFYTSKKRVVYGGGGIVPDVYIPIDTSYNLQYLYEIRSYIPEFIYSYYSDNQALFIQYKESDYFRNNFEVNESLYNRFLSYTLKQGLKKDEKELMMKAYLAKQMWKDDGYYPVMNTIDNTFLEAYKIVQNPSLHLAMIPGK
jgi:carboxyl-terminal processing protease